MKVVSLILAVGFYSSLGFAHSSEMFYQPLDGQTLVEGNLIYRSLDLGVEVPPSIPVVVPDIEFRDTAFDLKVEHGFSAVYSGYMALSFGNGDIDESDFKGLDLIHIGGQYQRHADELGRFIGTIDLGIALEDSDEDSRVSGQMVLTLGLGYEKHMGQNLFGGYASYGVIATDYKYDDISEPDEDAKGNLNLKLYYERSMGESSIGEMVFGGKLAYQTASVNYWQGSYIEDIDFDSIVLGGYTRIPMSEKFHLLAGLDYRISVDEPEDLDDLSGYEVRLGGRMIF